LVDLVQRHLRDLGYDPGPVDGLIGPRTREAIRRFERDRGDTPTGSIRFVLLEQLRSAFAPGSREGTSARGYGEAD
jgi:peptidoglycan hydrolase-like protein with peptidoglycan-binding domain